MKKIFRVIVIALVVIFFARLLFGAQGQLDFIKVLDFVSDAQLIDHKDFYYNVVSIKYSVQSFANYVNADAGETYITYRLYETTSGSSPGGAIQISSDYWLVPETRSKPVNTFFAITQGIGEFMEFVFNQVCTTLFCVLLDFVDFGYKLVLLVDGLLFDTF